jgi:hypothetical protein
MVTLIFLAVIVGTFIGVLMLESDGRLADRRPAGLLTWMTSGNWPAKIGAALLIVGVGALLRYAVLHIDLPPSIKLGVGIAAVAVLGVGAMFTGARRAVSLALGGAAFGVAYLTAYSAYALFGYLPTLQGLGALALTAVGAGVFAVSRSALSLAVLAMVGAFLAPAFAVDDPGPRYVYGYYIAVSLLTLVMVTLRGWRPLIHLSFLFTLAGGVFFAWTADYFSAAHATVLLPLIVALVGVHVAMPLLERQGQPGRFIESLDTAYLLVLPVAAALTALAVSPGREMLAVQLWWYAAIWAVAAAVLHLQKREGMATHAVIALLMLGFGLAARFRDLPWELVTLAIAVAALALAERRSDSPRMHSFLAGLVLVLGAVHVLSALAPARGDLLFLNGRFFERIIGAGLLVTAGFSCRRLRHSLDGLLLAVGACWAVFAVGAELARLELITVALALHWACALAGIGMYFLGARNHFGARASVPLVGGLLLTLLLARPSTSLLLGWASLALATLSCAAMALRPVEPDEPRVGRYIAYLGMPVLAALWGARIGHEMQVGLWQFALMLAAAVSLVAHLVASKLAERTSAWWEDAAHIVTAAFTFVLAVAVLMDIERSVHAVVLEFLCLGLLAAVAGRLGGISARVWVMPALLLGVALMLQANLLRWMGPERDLDVFDITDMRWPTLVSLLWAAVGASLTIFSRRKASRTLWMAGAVFLVGSAVKLLLLDFGSLGQLANILAVIAAGVVFLLVGWLAPMPPAPPEDLDIPVPHGAAPAPAASAPRAGAAAQPAPQAVPAAREMNMPDTYWNAHPRTATRVAPEQNSAARFGWTLAFIAVVLITLSHCGSDLLGRERLERVSATVPAVEVETFGSTDPAADRIAEPRADPAERMRSQDATIRQLLSEGLLRPATQREFAAWQRKDAGHPHEEVTLQPPQGYDQFVPRTYVVLGDIELPSSGEAAEEATYSFLVPRGVPRPGGEDDSSVRILDMNP